MAFATLPGVLSGGPDWCARRYASVLCSDLSEAILDVQQPPLVMVKHIQALDIPLEWNAQRQVFARFNE
jgi:hypothetical protein